MGKATTEEKSYLIKMTLQGSKNCISIGKGAIKALGSPSHVSLKISDNHDSISVFPCDEDDVMAFRVPPKLFTDRNCTMRIFSKRFVHVIMIANSMNPNGTYTLCGEYIKDKNIAVFSLVEGVTPRNLKEPKQA